MAWTATDLTNIETAIARGELSVQVDGKSVTYRSVSELLKARDAIKDAIAATAGTTGVRSTLATFSKG